MLAISLLRTCINCKTNFLKKKTNHVISLYRSPLETPDQFNKFLETFEELLQDIF